MRDRAVAEAERLRNLSDDELIADAIRYDMGRDSAVGGVLHTVVDQLVDDWSRPGFRAGAAVGIASTAVMARMGVRGWVAVIAGSLLWLSAERLYEMAEEITEHLGAPGAAGED